MSTLHYNALGDFETLPLVSSEFTETVPTFLLNPVICAAISIFGRKLFSLYSSPIRLQ